MQRSGSKSASDENDRSTNPIVFEHGQMLIRGASTVTVPKSVWMVRVRQSRWRRILRHAGQTRAQNCYSSIWVCSTRRCRSASTCFASSGQADLLGRQTNDAPLEVRHFEGFDLTPTAPRLELDPPFHDRISPTEPANRPRSRRKDQFLPLPRRRPRSGHSLSRCRPGLVGGRPIWWCPGCQRRGLARTLRGKRGLETDLDVHQLGDRATSLCMRGD